MWLALLGGFIAYGIVIGYYRFNSRRIAAKERYDRHLVESRLSTAEKGLEEVTRNSMKLTEVEIATERAAGDLDAKFKDLPHLRVSRIIGGPPAALPPDISAVFEDSDVLLVVAFQLGLFKDSERASLNFTKLARYWRYVANYPRAQARAENATKLNPNSSEAFRELAMVLSNSAADSGTGSSQKSDILGRAESALQQAVKLRGRHDSETLHDLAWIYDERREYKTAAVQYRRARELDILECEAQGREPNHDITYDLACTLAKDKAYEESLREVEAIVDKDENWRGILGDRDFAGLLDHETWGPKLRSLAQQAEARATSSASSSSG